LWFKINKTNDYTLLIRTGRATDEECEQSWLQIMNQYIEQVGINDNYKQLIEAKKNLALALVEYHITGDAHNLNFVKIHEEEIKVLEQDNQSEAERDEYDLIVTVERTLKVQIDEHTCSTKKFFSYLNQAKEENDRLEALNNKKDGNN